jgi:hypothetical protein
VISRGSPEFWQLYHKLPEEARSAAQKAFRIFLSNPAYPSLRLERLRIDRRAWAVRITRDYRAVALRQNDVWIWVWIGSHAEFDRRFPK